MPSLPQALAPWHDFFALVGTAAATLIGLLFVAASVGSEFYTAQRMYVVRAFLSSSVVHFACVLAACLSMLVPIGRWEIMAVLTAGIGVFGMCYAVLVWRTMVQTRLIASLDVSDRLFYCRLPVLGHAILFASAGAFLLRVSNACGVLALAVGVLLFGGIRNAWDITVWAVTRSRGGGS